MFVNMSTLVAALVMIIVPFLQELKAIVVELGRDKSKVQFSGNGRTTFLKLGTDKSKVEEKEVFRNGRKTFLKILLSFSEFFFETRLRWTTSRVIRLFLNTTMNWEQNQRNWVRMINDHSFDQNTLLSPLILNSLLLAMVYHQSVDSFIIPGATAPAWVEVARVE